MRQALCNAGIPANELAPLVPGKPGRELVTMYHCTPDVLHTNDAFTFAFVRNPLEYYRSYWSHMMRAWGRPTPPNPFNDKYMRQNFSDFVRAVCEGQPGWVGRKYQLFCGLDGKRLDYIGRQETLADDLVYALNLAGEEFDEEALRNTPMKNISSKINLWAQKSLYSPSLAQLVIESEIEVFSLYGYSTDPTQVLRNADAVGECMYT